ncbi:MAG: hypothetical protein IKS19_07620 [Clostridia bacterium]|nr:hypothetical protein [Clostridia bacterium]
MELLKVSGFEHIHQVDDFKKLFEQATSEKDADGRYHRWLRQKLFILDNLGMEALKLEGFEPLSDTDPKLFSIRYPHSRVNPRIIYIYADKSEIYLLYAFKESSKTANSDYRAAIKTASNRLKYLL